ncbi:YkyA family protein [Pseudobacillus wudalianchiensis]|uniref:Lipoprotein n=1 Tax=Pseudobacillus wudalianchiensis TaxID=1743143 RepID=A0A1B9ATC8_9BACI|nr:YkyA family protein [Bacillus wudalianchiensis]OCA87039.1 hypothetical protein A8F95_07110 [Bacillus wudalianchiensis]
MKKKSIVSFMTVSVLLTGCGGSPEEKAITIFEKTAKTEEESVKQQEPLKKLENKELKIYEEMMAPSKKDKKQWGILTKKAKKNLEERKEKVSAEQEAMKNAADEFSKIRELKKQVDNKRVRSQLNELIRTMEARYEEHQKIGKLYYKILAENKKLYTILGKEKTNLGKVEERITNINQDSEKLKTANKRFNQLTQTVNKQKKLLEKLINGK